MAMPIEKANYDAEKLVESDKTGTRELKYALSEIIRLLRKIAGE